MITKFLSKLKSILFKSKTSTEISLPKKTVSTTNKKSVKSSKTSKTSKSKTKKDDSKKIIEAFKAIPGVGAKSAEAFYKAGFKTPKSITPAKDDDLLAVPGVVINLVKKLNNIK